MILNPRAALPAFAFLFMLGTSCARADVTPAPSPSPPEIGRVTTSDRHDEPIDRTTRPTFVVDRAHIDARGDRTIADALAGVPGVEVSRYGAFGAQANLSIRGATTKQILVLVDGVPANPASSGQVDLGTLSSVGVRRIEIVEGGGSTLYGASAVGGVINIITDVPRGTYLEAASGSFGERDLRVGAGTGNLGVSFERHIARNDFGYPPGPGPSPSAGGTRANADAEQTAARIAYDVHLAPNLNARLRLDDDALHLGLQGALTSLSADARSNVSRNLANLDLTYGTDRATTILTLSGAKQILTFADPANPPESDTIDGRTQVSLREVLTGDRFTTVGGIDLIRESAVLTNVASYDSNFNVTGYTSPGVAQSQSAAYVQTQYATPSGFRAYAGLRGEHDAPLGGVIAPSGGVALPLAPGVRLAINANAAFRVPTIVDLSYPGFSNPSLKPERSNDGDITLQSDRVLGGATFGWFYRNATNLIQLDANSVPQNIAQATTRGLLATFRTRPLHGIVSTLSIENDYEALGYAPGSQAARLNFSPTFSASLGIERLLRTNGIGFGVFANIMSPHTEQNFATTPASAITNIGRTSVDAYVRGYVAPRAVLSLRVRNLGDERYSEVIGYPAPGRSFAVELSTR